MVSQKAATILAHRSRRGKKRVQYMTTHAITPVVPHTRINQRLTSTLYGRHVRSVVSPPDRLKHPPRGTPQHRQGTCHAARSWVEALCLVTALHASPVDI